MSRMNSKSLNYLHIKRFIGFSFASLAGIICSYVATYFLNAHFSQEEMGSYSYTFNVLNLLYPVVSLSLFSGYPRFLECYNEPLLIQFIKKISYGSVVLFAIIIFFLFKNWYYLAFAFIILYQEQLVLARSKLELLQFNVLNIAQKILFLQFLFLMRDRLTASNALLALGLSYFISCLLMLPWSTSSSVSPTHASLDKKVVLKFCFVAMCTGILNWIMTVSDQIIIKYYFGFAALAPYAVAYRIVMVLALIAGVFLSYYPNVYFKEFTSQKVKESLVLRYYFFFILGLSTLVMILLKNYVYTFFGAAHYMAYSHYLVPLLAGESCRIMASVLMTFLTYRLQQSTIFWTMALIAVLNIGLNWLLVPLWGPLASAYVTLFCFIGYLLGAFWFSYRPERRYLMRLAHEGGC